MKGDPWNVKEKPKKVKPKLHTVFVISNFGGSLCKFLLLDTRIGDGVSGRVGSGILGTFLKKNGWPKSAFGFELLSIINYTHHGHYQISGSTPRTLSQKKIN